MDETYVVSDEKQQLFDKLLELLSQFDKVCNEYGIKYYVFAGTMLGAIRHNGFIPWDDDVDVFLPRKDYNRLKAVMKNHELEAPFFFQSPETDIGYPKGFCRLRNSDTTEIPYDDVAMNCNRGIFIDIFPIDKVPDDENLFKKQIKKLKRIRLFMNSHARYYSGFGAQYTTNVKKIAYYLSVPLFKLHIITMKRLFEKYEKVASMYENKETKKCGTITFSFDNPRFIYETNCFIGGVLKHNFEMIKVPIPEKYDNILKHTYGDYMTPVQAPTEHGELVFSSTIPYTQYVKSHMEELKQRWITQTEGYK